MGGRAMIGALTYASVAILLGWVAYALTGLFASVPVALIAGGVIGALSVLVFRDTIAIRADEIPRFPMNWCSRSARFPTRVWRLPARFWVPGVPVVRL